MDREQIYETALPFVMCKIPAIEKRLKPWGLGGADILSYCQTVLATGYFLPKSVLWRVALGIADAVVGRRCMMLIRDRYSVS